MGNKFTILVWTNRSGEFQDELYWVGESLLKMLIKTIQAKREGFGCVKVEWR